MIITATYNHGKESTATSSAPRSVRILYQICRGDSRIARRWHPRHRPAPKPPLRKGRETRPLRCRTRCDSSRRGRVTRPLYAPPIMHRTKPPFEGGRLRAPPVADTASNKEWQRSKFGERMRATNFGYRNRGTQGGCLLRHGRMCVIRSAYTQPPFIPP